MSSPCPSLRAAAAAVVVANENDDTNDDPCTTTFATIPPDELAAVVELVQNLNLSTQSSMTMTMMQQQQPTALVVGLTGSTSSTTWLSPERLQFITLRLLQQQSGHLCASVNAALTHQWESYNVDDYIKLYRDPSLFGGDKCDGSSSKNGGGSDDGFDTDDDDNGGGRCAIQQTGGSAGGDCYGNTNNGFRTTNGRSSSSAIVMDIYRTTRAAAQQIGEDENFVSDSPTPMKASGAVPARLLDGDRHVELVTYGSGAAHLIPPTGPTGRADTWIYLAGAALGLRRNNSNNNNNVDHDDDDSDYDPSVLMKALRGCWKSAESTLHNTGLNRSPTNLVRLMDHPYVLDGGLSTCVMILPIMSLDAARQWTGEPYSVIILCDDDRHGRATHQQVAQRIGLTSAVTTTATNHGVVEAATAADVQQALALMSHVLKFSSYALEQKPGPPSPRGAALWLVYRDELEAARTLFASIVGGTRQDYQSKVVVPVAKPGLAQTGKMVAKVDLGIANINDTGGGAGGGRRTGCTTNGIVGGGGGGGKHDHVVVYPDPLLLAAKSSVVWTRKFAFQLMAEAEPSAASLERTRQQQHFANGEGDAGGGGGAGGALDLILGKNVAFGSQNDGSRESYGDFTG